MLLIAFGTRPEYLKLLPIIEAIDNKIKYKIIFTGQHQELLKDFKYSSKTYNLSIRDGENRLDNIVSSMMNLRIWRDIKYVMVQGDTTSAFAIALAAFHRQIPVIHLEAGMRTYDNNNPYPEEANRKMISSVATYHLCPTIFEQKNLRDENIIQNVWVVGNSVLDNLKDLQITYNKEVIITLHRRENHNRLPEWFSYLEKLAKENKDIIFTFISHPNPNVKKHLHLLDKVNVIEPLSHQDFLKKLASCLFVITDSGGLQEESSFLRKFCIVCRKETERVSGLNSWAKLVDDEEGMKYFFDKFKLNYKPKENMICPYGDGDTSQKVLKILQTLKVG
jgi:UDP-N-acetylglucosamine 2-epimerase (non-hydrolysing)